MRKRLAWRPLALMWLVIALFAVGRFFEFFVRSDSADLALGLEIAQWTSLLRLGVAAAGASLTLGHQTTTGSHPRWAPARARSAGADLPLSARASVAR